MFNNFFVWAMSAAMSDYTHNQQIIFCHTIHKSITLDYILRALWSKQYSISTVEKILVDLVVLKCHGVQ